MDATKIRNPRAFAKLPSRVQAFINSLDDEVRSQIGNSFCKAYFDFLQLPLEIRFMIYRVALASETGRVRLSRKNPLPGKSLFVVSKRINAEAMMAVGETNCCVVEWSQKRVLQRVQRECLKNFRHFKLSICIDACFEPVEARKSRLCKFLTRIAEQLIEGHKNSSKEYSISIELCFTSKEVATSNYIDPKLGHTPTSSLNPDYEYGLLF